MQNTKIEWTDMSWNPVTGCLTNCSYCYARAISKRFGRSFSPKLHVERLTQPMKTTKPKRIFVCSMADLFGTWVPFNWIDQVLEIAKQCPQHTFQFLTKYPKRYQDIDWPINCWVGATATNQLAADVANVSMKEVNADIRYVSCEPLFTNVRLNGAIRYDWVIIGACTGRRVFQPPRKWVNDLTADARKMGAALFYKPNLQGYPEIREFPGDKGR